MSSGPEAVQLFVEEMLPKAIETIKYYKNLAMVLESDNDKLRSDLEYVNGT